MATKKTFVAKYGLTVGNTATGGSFTMPSSDGSASQVIITDGSGNLSWSTQSGGISDITGESIKDFSDVYSSMTPTDGQALVYDTTNGWQAETLSGGGGGTSPGDGPDPIYTSSTSDPTTSTNPSSNGAIWFNSSANTFYVCIDNTSGSNIWKGGSIGDIVEAWYFQGENYGYDVGGYPGSLSIDKYSLTSDGNAVSHGSLSTQYIYAGACAWTDGSTNGFAAGYPSQPYSIYSQKFPFASTTGSSYYNTFANVLGKYGSVAFSSSSYGYRAGGYGSPPSPTPWTSEIDKFPFAGDALATTVGQLTEDMYYGAGCQTFDTGYRAGGYGSTSPLKETIDKWPFASEGNATDHGDLWLNAKYGTSGCSSTTHGYVMSGTPTNNTIQKFPFASTTGASDVGDLVYSMRYVTNSSSMTHGYVSGGTIGNAPGRKNNIQKFPFSTDANTTDVGDLTVSKYFGAGTQY